MMGLFNVTVGVGHPGGGDLSEVSAMVDTGAAHSVLPESLLTNIGIDRSSSGRSSLLTATKLNILWVSFACVLTIVNGIAQ